MAITQTGSGGVKADAITLSHLAAGTDGQIITYDASGNPVAVGPGTDGQVLTSTGAGSPPAFETLPSSGVTVSNNTNNRVVTGDGTNLNAEANLTFDGTTLQLGGATADSADIDSSNTKLTIKQSANNTEDGIFIERSGERRGFYIHIGGALGVSDGLGIVSSQHGTETAVFAIDRGGDVKIGAGNLAFSTSGKGIDFSSTSDATGMSSELLSDYEVGTWTPAFSGLSNTPTFAGLQGKYVKVGNIVQISAWMQAGSTLPTFTTTGDPLTITGIPYTANGSGYVNAHGAVSWSQMDPWGSGYNETPHGDTTGHIAVGIPDGTNIRFYVSGANDTQRGRVKNNALHNSGFILEWSLTYQTNS